MAAKRKYRWEQWFAEPRTVLLRGVDYECSQSTMVAAIRNRASERGLRVRVVDNGDSIMVEVRGERAGLAINSDPTGDAVGLADLPHA